jgi:very-short-patch-repair endonuclease
MLERVEALMSGKGIALLRFLKDAATLRRKRVPSYGSGDKLVWFDDVPKDRPECRSAFLTENPAEFPDIWLEVRKRRMPTRPPVPKVTADWVRPQDLEQSDHEPELLPEITVLVERRVPDPEAPLEQPRTVLERVPELRRLRDHPQVRHAWLEYLVNQWEPWAQEMRRWQEVQRVYEDVDFMRRRLEESEERYELLLAVGLLQWRDSTGATVKRHLLTGPAEIGLNAARGILTVAPAASFEGFRIELDMLELHDQPRLEGAGLQEHLEELNIQAWDTARVGEILRGIANRANANAQVDEKALIPADRADETFRVVYAPALVLRERRPTTYEELVARLLKGLDGDTPTATTRPWERFLREGAPSGNLADPPNGQPTNDIGLGDLPIRLLFPLPTNDEQRQIANRLRAQPYVLVKGPPGTGKSLTIANLICHLLASGERVLVTAHAPKALTVLRGLLPDDVRDLCVTALGSSREDQRLLEEGVRGILGRQSEWRGAKWAQARIEELEHELQQLQNELAQTERRLRECREAETHPHSLSGGYEGTAASIARQLEQQREMFGWFPESPLDQTPFPLQPDDIRLLAEVHAQLTDDWLQEVRLETGASSLPAPDDFTRAVEELEAAETAAERAVRGAAKEEKVDSLRDSSPEALEKSQASLIALEKHAALASRLLGGLADEILKDLLVGHEERWNRLARDVTSLLKPTGTLREQLGTARVELPPDVDHDRVRADARRRLEHFEKGGHRGFSIFTPRVVGETRYVEKRCKVDGRAPSEAKSLAKLVAFLQLAVVVEEFARLWPAPVPVERKDPRDAASAASDQASELERLLASITRLGSDCFPCIPVAERVALVTRVERAAWLSAIEAETAIRRGRAAKEPLSACLLAIRRCLEAGRAHRCLNQLAEAVEKRDTAKWQVAWELRERLRTQNERLRRYEAFLATLDQACPGVGAVVRKAENGPDGKAQLLQLEKAWAWACACTWIRRVSDAGTYRDLGQSTHRLQAKIEDKIKELAALQAWRVFFERLDDATVQNLNAWTKAVDRIGKGTGKYAYRHRRTARGYLAGCIPKIPAWIMPLHKLWDSVDPEPGLFDTVIVDEASQAGIESLALLLLAKRIVVVGDDKQNSPEAVGVLEDDIVRLARQHLTEFAFRDEFRPDTSLFDHAERAFGNLISLREHFRCVPEIIRFSNDLCYRDAPLIPLRQAPPNRLPPLKSLCVRDGACQGDGQRIHNRAEAEAVVEAIQACIEDETYEGKTMGVIALQGHAQTELIGNMLAQKLDPKVIEERKLRCGVPATFQGDQRDIIFLSLVIAPNVQHRALSRLPDQRRFNVAMSRARDQVWLFHSVQQHDLNPECLRRRLLSFFQSPTHEALDRLCEDRDRLEREVRQRPRQRGTQPDPYGSWFEVDVALELLRMNYQVRPQYELAGYRIDLVIEDLVLNSRLAVECDGDTWHGPERYEQDMARERQLERAGCTFVRIRESEFYADRVGAVQQIREACEALGIRSMDHLDGTERQQSHPEAGAEVATVAGDGELTSELDAADTESTAESSASVEYGPFTGYSELSGFPDPREASPANVRAALRQIIERDGPLTRASVFRLYVEGCPDLQRAGKAVRQALNRALGALFRSGEIVQEDELGDGSPEGQVIRLAGTPKVRERLAGRRDLLEIPPSELHLVLDRLRPAGVGAEEDDESLLRGLLEHYSFGRLTGVRRKHLIRVLEIRRLRRKGSDAAMETHEGE